MTSRALAAIAAGLLLVACAEDAANENTDASLMPTAGMGGAAGAMDTGGAGGMASGDAGGMDAVDTDGGDAMTGGGGAAGDDPRIPEDAIAPMIPDVDGECPEFVTGTQEVMGTTIEIVAGPMGEIKGPLLFTFHGTGGTGALALRQVPASVQDDIKAQGGIVIAPSDNGAVREGTDVTFVLGVWYDIADLKMADQIVACAVQNHNIDPRKIYVTGCSAGGLMAGVMSVRRSSYIAAAAPNSGGVALTSYMFDNPEHAPAVLAMHGGTNDNVIVNFGDTTHNLSGLIVAAGGFFVECNHMIGHCQAPPALHENAWAFMQAHPFGVDPEPYEAGLPGDFPDYCMINE